MTAVPGSSFTLRSPGVPTRSKFADIEFVRGLAAFGVVIYHFLLAVLPPASLQASHMHGLVPESPVLLAPFNGRFMVAVFFVLSSFVLTVKLVHSPSWRVALIAILKRFPRLLPLTLIGALLPAVLFALGLMRNEEVAALTGSQWLAWSGGVKVADAWPEPSVVGGLVDAFVLFERGVSQYNSALWTMRYELIGSVFAIATAMLIGADRRPILDAVIVGSLGVIFLPIHPLVSICIGTVWISKYVVLQPRRVARGYALGLIVLGLALGSTFDAVPRSLGFVTLGEANADRLQWLAYGAGAMLVFIGVRSLGSLPLQDRGIARQLGRLSFPIYVLHIPIQGSLGCAIILAMGYTVPAAVTAFLVSTIVIFAVAVPVARLDEWWVRHLGAAARLVTTKRALPRAAIRDPAP